MITVSQASKNYNMSVDAIRQAIYYGRIPYVKRDLKLYINPDDLTHYIKSKHTPSLKKHDGKPLYDREVGEMSPKEMSLKYHLPLNQIYYYMKKNMLPSFKKRNFYVLKVNDIEEFLSKYQLNNI